jgi:uncharacterized paraquat-inducible protein A
MLQLDVTHAFVALAVVLLAILLFLSLYDSWRARSHGWTMAEEILGECAKCHLMFLVSRYERVVRCPRCSTVVQTASRSAKGSRSKGR